MKYSYTNLHDGAVKIKRRKSPLAFGRRFDILVSKVYKEKGR